MSLRNLKLKALRVEHGLKQTDVAKLIGMHENTYVRKENGITEFTESEIIAICKLFNKRPDEIFFQNQLTKTTNCIEQTL